jgi:GH24 family phage-related lysozyme (muramidase)
MIRLKHLLTEAAPLSADNTFREKVKGWEGPGPVDANKNHLAYDDANPSVAAKPGVPIRGTLTIGYGTTGTVLPTLKAGMKISPATAEKLLIKGIANHESKARQVIPKYDSYPTYVREAILNAIYRGDLGPATIKLINAGSWSNVSAEYLKHKNYTNPGSMSGVVTRMKSNADAFTRYSKELRVKTPPKDPSIIGQTVYPIRWEQFANVRETPDVDNGTLGIGDNLITTVHYPDPIGMVIKIKRGGDSKIWYQVKLSNKARMLEPSANPDVSVYGWVRSDVANTTGN